MMRIVNQLSTKKISKAEHIKYHKKGKNKVV